MSVRAAIAARHHGRRHAREAVTGLPPAGRRLSLHPSAAVGGAVTCAADAFLPSDPRGPIDESRVNVLVDDLHEPGDNNPTEMSSPPGLTPRQQADSIIAAIRASRGAVLLCLPGTLGSAWQSTMYETARAAMRETRGPLIAVSIPYPNSIADVVGRVFGMHWNEDQDVLAMVIRAVKAEMPDRPILLAGESQGAWVVAHDMQDPSLAAAVTRTALFAIPGIQAAPPAVGQARTGAGALPGAPGSIVYRHTDDIVPSLVRHLGLQVLEGYVLAIRRYMLVHDFEYTPHHYDVHGPQAAHFLLTGDRPSPHDLVHPSSEDL